MNGQFFIKNGEAKYGVPSGDFLENEKTGKESHVATMLLLGNGVLSIIGEY